MNCILILLLYVFSFSFNVDIMVFSYQDSIPRMDFIINYEKTLNELILLHYNPRI